MYIRRWPWITFAFLAFVAACVDTKGAEITIIYPAVIVAGLLDIVIVLKWNQGMARIAYAAAWGLSIAAYALSLGRAGSGGVTRLDDVVIEVNDVVLGLLVAGRFFAVAGRLAVAVDAQSPKVVRVIAYSLGIFIVQVLAAIHVRELSKLLDHYGSLQETTTAPCILSNSTNSTNGFIFATSPFEITCPTRVWSHIRINLLFASQIYALYTITTDVWKDANSKTVFQEAVLALVECLALSAAVSIQFDTLPGAQKLSIASCVLAYVAIAAYISRVAIEQNHDNVKQDEWWPVLLGRQPSRVVESLLNRNTYRRPLKDVRLML